MDSEIPEILGSAMICTVFMDRGLINVFTDPTIVRSARAFVRAELGGEAR